MITTEDRLRAAMRAAADTVPPGAAPPFQLPPDPAPRPWRRRQGAGSGRFRALAPLAAAAAVIVVLAVAMAVAHGRPAHRAAPPTQHGSLLSQLPTYYVTLGTPSPKQQTRQGALGQPTYAVVRATATGKVLATVQPPRPYTTFSSVSAAADDRTFVLAASQWRKATIGAGGAAWLTTANEFLLLRLQPDGPPRLTALPIPRHFMTGRTYGEGMALSPDGKQLAVALRLSPRSPANPVIHVFNLATGAEKTWTWPGGGPVTNNAGGMGQALSFAADGTLAFQQWVGNSIVVRLLNTSGPGGSLQADSRPVLDWAGDAESLRFHHGRAVNVIFGFSALLTPDGSKIVCATVTETKHPLTSVLAFTEYSARTGRVVRQLGSWTLHGMYPGQTQDVLWTNSSGSTLIVVAHRPGLEPVPLHGGNAANYSLAFSAVTAKQFVPLAGAPPVRGPGSWPAW